VSGDEDNIGVGLGDAGGDGADTDLGDELHADAGAAVGVFQIVDQLGEVLDGVDVVVRRRRDEADAGGGVAGFRDPGINLGAGELSAFAGLRALCHLDLDFAGVDEVVARDAEAAGGDLFDGGVFGVAVGERDEALGIFAAFAGVGFSADAVHRDGERLVGFLRDGAVGHRAGFEAGEDFFDGLDFVDRDGVGGLEVEHAAERAVVLALLVDEA
jgi:hypothetical protein